MYDVAVVGGGHNGLVAAAYLAKAGLKVVVLERTATFGGAVRSSRVFPEFEANLSEYAYLVSLLPGKIVRDLKINFETIPRKYGSFTPLTKRGIQQGLLLPNDPKGQEDAIVGFTGSRQDWSGYAWLKCANEEMAKLFWPSMLEPLRHRDDFKSALPDSMARAAWDMVIERPLGEAIERLILDDTLRGLVFTDAKIGVSTYPHDPTLLENKTYLYHVIGNDGRWSVPKRGMGQLARELVRAAKEGGAELIGNAEVIDIEPGAKYSTLSFAKDGGLGTLESKYVLLNSSSRQFGRTFKSNANPPIDGSVMKVNILVSRLPEFELLPDASLWSGTVHVNEGYENMILSYAKSLRPINLPGRFSATLPYPFEIYCHSLTDPSILSQELGRRGYHTLTIFGLDMPYSLFTDRAADTASIVDGYLMALDRYTTRHIMDYIAVSSDGSPCISYMSPVDIEASLGMPRGNIFHEALNWPFAESSEEIGSWGVETEYPNIFICGAGARRGGGVSGIPGHNAAMKIFELENKGPVN